MTIRADRLIRCVRRIAAADPMPDAALLTRFLAGRDDAAFAALVDRHGPMVLRGLPAHTWQHTMPRMRCRRPFSSSPARPARSNPPMLPAWLHGVAWRWRSDAPVPRPATRSVRIQSRVA